MRYVFDTNVLIDWWDRRYPVKIFPSLQKAVNQLVSDRKLIAPQRVRDEIDKNASDGLREWAKHHKSLFVPHDEDLQEKAKDVQNRYPDLIDSNSIDDEADRWIIALASLNNLTVVTHETSRFKKKTRSRRWYIPDVCQSMSIVCIELLDLMRDEGWSF